MKNNGNKEGNKILELIKKYKKILGIGLLAIVIIIVVVIILASGGEAEKTLKAIFETDKPIAVGKDGKFGYIDQNGKEIIEAKYLSAGEFFSGYAVVSVENEGKTVYQIIDEAGEVILEAETNNEPVYYKTYGVWLVDDKLYDADMKVIYEEDSYIAYISDGYFTYMSNDGKESGVLDHTGKKVFTWEEDYISLDISSSSYDKDGLYAVVSNFEEVESIVNLSSGKSVYTLDDPKNKYIQEEGDGIFRVINRSESYKTEKWLYIRDNKVVYETDEAIYDIKLVDYEGQILKIDYGAEYVDAGKQERMAYYDVKDEKLLEEAPEGVTEMTDIEKEMNSEYGYKMSTCEEGVGLDKDGKSVIDCKYNEITYVNVPLYKYMLGEKKQELVLLEEENDTVLYNMKKKKEVETFSSTSVSSNLNSSFLNVTLYDENGYTKKGYVIYNVITGKSLEVDKSDEYEIKSNYVTVTKKATKTYYNAKLEKIYEENLK